MKVKKHGNMDKNWSTTIVCKKVFENDETPSCGARIEINEKDLRVFYFLGCFGGHHSYAGVYCPDCKKIIHVGKKLPYFVEKRLFSRKSKGKNKAIFDGFKEESGYS